MRPPTGPEGDPARGFSGGVAHVHRKNPFLIQTTQQIILFLVIPRLNEDPRSCVDTGGQVDSGVVDDSSWIFVRSGTRRTDSGRAGWPCGAPGGAAGERDCSFE